MSKTQRTVTAGLFAALGLIIPYLTSHAFGMAGTMLLPMHLPVLLCGLICGPAYGALCGALVPVLSSMLTGMPPVYPMLPIMTVQLILMGCVGGLLLHRFKLPSWIALVAAIVSGWTGYGVTFSIMLSSSNGPFRALSLSAALTQGIPGLVIQVVLSLALLAAIRRAGNLPVNNKKGNEKMQDIRVEAIALIRQGSVSVVVIKDERIVHKADGRGVGPLIALYSNEPEKLAGSYVVDKVIGKAAALILVLGGVSGVYGEIMSVSALDSLQNRGIDVTYGKLVDMITNRMGDGMCPIEQSVIGINDPAEGLASITMAVHKLATLAPNTSL